MRRIGARARAPEPPPGDLARERQLVEPLAPVAAHARGRTLASQAAAGTSKPASCVDDLGDAARALEPVLRDRRAASTARNRRNCGGRDGLDLLAQAVERVAMDAREQAAVAPRLPPVDAGAQDDALRLELESSGSSLDDRPQRLSRPRRTAFGSRGASAANQRSPSRATRPRRRELVEPRLPGAALLRRDVAHPEERLVDFLGVLGLRPGLLAHARDRLGIELAELVGGLRVERRAARCTACVRRSSSGASSRNV